jgi:hypothetical protein
MYEIVDGNEVHKAGGKVMELAERERWSPCLFYMVVLAVAEFLEAQGVEVVKYDDNKN